MYSCEICSKDYNTQKRFLAHMERHERDDNVSMRSGRSSRSNVISDIEGRSRSVSRSRSSTRVRDTVEKLVREKDRLKSEVKKYANELKTKAIDHQIELENSQEYFQEQISTLVEEKDDLLEQVSQSQDSLFQEKEKLRADFRRKLSAETKLLETRIGRKNSTRITRLQETISKLQSQLSQQSDEAENNRQTLESKLQEKDDMCQKKIYELTDRLFQVNQTLKNERSDIRKMTLLITDEKETFKRACKRDSEKTIKDCDYEKDLLKQSLVVYKQRLEEEYNSKKLALDNELKEIKIKHTHQIHVTNLDHKKAVADVETAFKNSITVLETENQKLSSQVSYIQSAMENMEKDTNRVKQKIIESLKKQIEEFGEDMKTKDHKIEQLENKIEEVYSECSDKIKCFKDKLQSCEIKLENEQQKCILKDTEINQIKRESKNLNDQRNTIVSSYEKRVATIQKECQLDIQTAKNITNEESLKEIAKCRQVHNQEMLNKDKENKASYLKWQKDSEVKHLAQINSIVNKTKGITVKLEVINKELKTKLKNTEEENTILRNDKNNVSKKYRLKQDELKTTEEAIADLKQQLTDSINKCNEQRKIIAKMEIENKDKIAKLSIRPRDKEAEVRLKKMRDDCLKSLREKTTELATVSDLLKIAEETIYKKTKQESVINKIHSELKHSFVNNLNTQKETMDSIIAEKQNIINTLKNGQEQMKQTLEMTVQAQQATIQATLAENKIISSEISSEKTQLLKTIYQHENAIKEKDSRILDLEKKLNNHLKKK